MLICKTQNHAGVPCAGYKLGLPLPYRGQPPAVFPSEAELSKVPAGICRAILKRNRMLRGSLSIKQPMPHAGLGLPAYTQVTSPIRRYGDLIAHWQLKVIPHPIWQPPLEMAWRVMTWLPEGTTGGATVHQRSGCVENVLQQQ